MNVRMFLAVAILIPMSDSLRSAEASDAEVAAQFGRLASVTFAERPTSPSTVSRIHFPGKISQASAIHSLKAMDDLSDPGQVTLEFTAISPELIDELAKLSSVLKRLKAVELGFGTLGVSEERFSQALQIPRLTAISSMNAVNIGDTALKASVHASDLEVLSLYKSRISDQGLEYLSKCTKLRELTVAESPVTGTGFEHLAALPLVHLGFAATSVTDSSLAHLSGMNELESLVFSECPIDGSGLKHLRKLKRLRRLVLTNTDVSDDGVAILRDFPALETLSLNGTNISDECLGDLVQLRNLKRLYVGDTKIRAAGLRRLKNELPDTAVDGTP